MLREGQQGSRLIEDVGSAESRVASPQYQEDCRLAMRLKQSEQARARSIDSRCRKDRSTITRLEPLHRNRKRLWLTIKIINRLVAACVIRHPAFQVDQLEAAVPLLQSQAVVSLTKLNRKKLKIIMQLLSCKSNWNAQLLVSRTNWVIVAGSVFWRTANRSNQIETLRDKNNSLDLHVLLGPSSSLSEQ